MTPVQADPDAPRLIADLPDYWDRRREREGKDDLSRCGADLRQALTAPRGATQDSCIRDAQRLAVILSTLRQHNYGPYDDEGLLLAEEARQISARLHEAIQRAVLNAFVARL